MLEVQTRAVAADAKGIAEAARILRAGGLVAFPTETVYGLGADATQGEAVAAIFAAKGRPLFNPLIVHVTGLDDARAHVEFSPRAQALAEKFWPGPLTLVLPRRKDSPLSLLVSAGLGLHHAGVEQHWWPGPAECTSGSSGAKSIEELKAMLMKEKVVQCDEIAWKFLGLSMAAWNGLVSLIAGGIILTIAGRRRDA